MPLVIDYEKPWFQAANITFASLSHLDSIGLIKFSDISGFARTWNNKYANIFYYGRHICIEFDSVPGSIDIGKVLFTSVGQELAPICGSNKVEDHFNDALMSFYNQGYTVSTNIDSRPYWL